MEYLQTLLDNSEIPIITAFLLGLLTAVSPCPLATNITAIGFISKDINNRNRIFTNGILYTLGRVLAYSVLGAILIAILRKGADMFAIQKGISEWGELLLAPALMLIGLFMLFGDKLQLPKFGFSATEKTEKLKGSWGSLLLGILFAMAFCPTSGLFYFGMLIPMSAMESEGYLLPVIFALATGLPVMLVAWILAYSVAGIGKFYNRVQTFQKWFNNMVAILFILAGISGSAGPGIGPADYLPGAAAHHGNGKPDSRNGTNPAAHLTRRLLDDLHGYRPGHDPERQPTERRTIARHAQIGKHL